MLYEDKRATDKGAVMNPSDFFSTSSPSSSSSSFSSAGNGEPSASGSTLWARKHEYDKVYSNMRRRVEKMWGPEEPCTPTAESTSTWLQSLYYTWVMDYVRLAVREQLRVEDLPSLSRAHRAHHCGLQLSAVTQSSLQRRHGWGVLVGMNVRSRDDPASRGTLRWVGVPQSGVYHNIMAAVTWSVAPAQRVAERSGDYSPFFHGVAHGETLFPPESTDNSTLEEPQSLEVITRDDKEAAVVASIQEPKRLSLTRDLFKALPGAVLWQIPGKVIGDICTLTLPMLLRKYVVFLTGESPSWGSGLLLVLALFLIQATQSVALHRFYYVSINGGLCYRSALTAVIFEKCFVISSKSLSIPEMSTGRIINMVSTDVEKANDFLQFCMYLWSSPSLFTFSTVLLVYLVGWSALVAVLALGVTLLLNVLVMRRMMRLRAHLAKATDARVKATNEFFSGIRIAKFMTWEPRFIANIEEKRDIELHYIRLTQYCRILNSFLNNATPPVMIAIVLLIYNALGNELTPEVVFPTISLLATIRMPFNMIPMAFNMGAQYIISMKRIASFLECENSSRGVSDRHSHPPAAYGTGRESWCESAAFFENTDITALVPAKLPRAPRVVLSLTARLMRCFCCCDNCRPPKKWSSPTEVKEPENEPEPSPSASSDATVPSNTKNLKKNQRNGSTDNRFELIPKAILKDVSINIPKGKFTVIIGPTGSGKSTLLMTLLGEYEVTKGRVWATRSIAYVPQQPWIMNATLRENILLFSPEDPKRLKEAVRVCQLEADLGMLAGGMQTEIGEKGINLSGGQKARVSLARAVYSNRELYLLDDPLSALDAHVGERIVTDVLMGQLANKTRVLATHQLRVLSYADYVVVMGDGTVRFAGGRVEFLNSPVYKEILINDAAEQQQQQQQRQNKEHQEENDNSDGTGEGDEKAPNGADGSQDNKGTMMTVEEKAAGAVLWSTYGAYFLACGGVSVVMLVLFVFFFTEMLTLSSNVWLSMWSTKRYGFATPTYLYVYIALVSVGTIAVPLRFGTAYSAMRQGARNMHRLILRSVSLGTVQFFDTTPLGRIVNRFSRDIDRIDDELQMTFIMFLQVLFAIFSSLFVTIESQPYVIIAIIPTAFFYYKLIIFYNISNREIRRVGSLVKAPLISLLGEVLVGSSTISAYRCGESVMKESQRRIDRVYASSFIGNATNRWLGVRVDFLGNVVVVFIALLGVIGTMLNFSTHDIGLISLSLTMALSTTSQLNWLVRMIGTLEADMNSVERILYYTTNIDREDIPEISALVDELRAKNERMCDATATVVVEDGSGDKGSHRLDMTTTTTTTAGWLEFRDVEMRYRAGLPLVLNKVSFRIEPREKVGIVGRTGSGKSTLLLTFMRMVDICGGDIVVSGRPIRSYGLRELRQLFSMIPQDPVLFDGTVRSNLDPFLEATPAEVWRALELVGMRGRVEAEGGGIDGRVREGGANYSVGQRQLLCLARALLRRNSGFILMDEATANIDHALDRQIQQTIMTAFTAHTVITIAHRLHTVATYDKIIVMDHGVVAESGSPRELISDPSSKFMELVSALGEQEAADFMSAVGV